MLSAIRHIITEDALHVSRIRLPNREDRMKTGILVAGAAAAFVLAGASVALAQAGGTGPEAQAMLEKGIAALKANEADALAKFVKKDGGFVDRDLYVFCFNVADGKFTAHINPKLMGTDIRALKEPDGAPLGQKIFDTIKANGPKVSTVDYKFPRPGTTEAVPKQSFVVQVGNQGCGVGYYK
jgi:hypothetical protein